MTITWGIHNQKNWSNYQSKEWESNVLQAW